MIVVAHNLAAMNANRQLNIVGDQKKKSTEKLSSGYRINRAADDAAGLAISEKLRWQTRGLNRASMNCKEGIGYVQVADGALQETHKILQRLNELAVQSANDTNTQTDRAAIDQERGHLVSELNRIFTDTSFNERKIWDPGAVKLKNPPTPEYETIHHDAVDVDNSYSFSDITDENSGTVPARDITVNASVDDGLSFNWTGYNGYTYTTGKIDWDTLQKNNYQIKLSDLYPTGTITSNGSPVASASFYDSKGNPLIDANYSFSRYEKATIEDVVKSLNGSTLSVIESAPLNGRFEDQNGKQASNGFSVTSVQINYSSAYKSYINKNGPADYDSTKTSYDFDKGTDSFFTPINREGKELNATSDDYTGIKIIYGSGNLTKCPDYDNLTVDTAKNDSTPFSFSYYLNGVGRVNADLADVSYTGGSLADPNDENVWWKWMTYSDGSKHQASLVYSENTSDLKGIMEVLKGSNGKPGILKSSLGGRSEYGGQVNLEFYLKDQGGSIIGNVKIGQRFSNDVTEEKFYDAIKESLNKDTILDLYTSDSQEASTYDLAIYAKDGNNVDIPEDRIKQMVWHYPLDYEADPIQLIIQDGALKGNRLDISYENMSLVTIGLAGMDMLTQQNASQAIDLVGYAIEKVSKERAVFGAYQNRLEHTIANVDNTAENTDAAESKIRDTDMPKEMVYFSMQSILEQAGQSVLAQTNQITQGVLDLLH